MCLFLLCRYQNETQRFLEREVDANWRTLRPLVDTNKKGAMAFVGDNSNLVISGAMCVVSAVVLTVGLWASSKTMGHYFTVKKVLVSCSLAGVCSSVVLVSLSIFYGAKGIGGAWAPGTTAVSGVAILLLSLLGMYVNVHLYSLRSLSLALPHFRFVTLFIQKETKRRDQMMGKRHDRNQ